jgi:Citrate transporter
VNNPPQAQREAATREVLAGLVERVTFHNAENGFCVLRIKARGHRELITVIGHAAVIAAGEWVTASGEWVNDQTHGQQFKSRFIALAPLVLELTLRMGRKPVPYLLAVAMASNVGSTATITGNPQNIMIGSFSQIPYTTFTLALGPVAAVGLVITAGLVALLHREEFAGGGHVTALKPNIHVNRVLVARALSATAVMVAAFFAGQPPAKAAIIIGGLLLLTRRVKSERVYAEIDWSLLLMFAGLFIIVAGGTACAAHTRPGRRRGRPAPGSGPHPERGDGRAVEPGQQRAGCADDEAVR